MNSFRKYALEKGWVKAKNREEAVHMFTNNVTSIMSKYVGDVKKHDPTVVLPEHFDAVTTADKKTFISSIKSSVFKREIIPFISRKDSLYVTPEYDLLMVYKFYNNESLFSRSVLRYVEQILKQDFKIVSQNKENLDFVKTKLATLASAASGANPGKWTWHGFLNKLATHLVIYNNAYVHRLRDKSRALGKSWHLFGNPEAQMIEPIAGMFAPDPVKMRTKLDRQGRIKEYLLDTKVYFRPKEPRGGGFAGILSLFRTGEFGNLGIDDNDPDVVTYKADEVDHITGPGHQEGTVLARPLVWPVIPDIKALRALEEQVELLVYQFASGILHGQVGTDDHPAQPGEVENFQTAIDNMQGNGGIVTSHRHLLKMIGMEGQVMDVTPYLEWFLKRINVGLGVNPSVQGIGETTNKASSGVLDKSFQGSVVSFQKIMCCYLTAVFDHFLFESGVKPWELTDETRVYCEAPEIDQDKMVQLNNDTIQQWINNCITHSEMRRKLRETPVPEHAELYFKDFVTAEQIEIEAEHSMQLERQKAAVSNKTGPANQNGKKTRPKSASDAVRFATDNMRFVGEAVVNDDYLAYDNNNY